MRSQFGLIFSLCIFAIFSLALARISDKNEVASDKQLKESERKKKCMYLQNSIKICSVEAILEKKLPTYFTTMVVFPKKGILLGKEIILKVSIHVIKR